MSSTGPAVAAYPDVPSKVSDPLVRPRLFHQAPAGLSVAGCGDPRSVLSAPVAPLVSSRFHTPTGSLPAATLKAYSVVDLLPAASSACTCRMLTPRTFGSMVAPASLWTMPLTLTVCGVTDIWVPEFRVYRKVATSDAPLKPNDPACPTPPNAVHESGLSGDAHCP